MAQLSAVGKNLKGIFDTHGVKTLLSEDALEQFAKFYKFLMDYNQKYNLTRLKTFNDVAVKHFVDCLYPLNFIDLPNPLIDMGTGPGFPGIPLKIARPETRIILVEGVQKKVEYLKALRDHLGLKNLDIIGRKVDSKMHYPAMGVITRAVEPVTDTLKNVVNCVQTGGTVMLMKTPGIDGEIKTAQDSMGEIYNLEKNIDYTLGSTAHDRKLLVYRKIRN